MSLNEFLSELDTLAADGQRALDAVADPEMLEAARIEFLGSKSGRLRSVQSRLAKVAKSDKPAAGKRFNLVKRDLEATFEATSARIASQQTRTTGGPSFDPTLPGQRPSIGRLHPITQTIIDLKEIMGRLGFSVADGPEIENTWYNFEALNIAESHPARDPLDNFYLATATKDSGPMLLRSQTSTIQIRVMEKTPPPVRVIALGRVYRPDDVDATHFPMFHQMEGLLVDRNVTLADLKSVLRLFAMSYFGGDVHIRFRPSFFPFTEPSVEVDMSWQGGWIEMGGAGMVDPAVFEAVGYDPEEISGFAFGLGIDRICMNRYGLTDIRELFRNDTRFLQQF